jgi:hypothetical protein
VKGLEGGCSDQFEVLCWYSHRETEGIREKREPRWPVFRFRALPPFPLIQGENEERWIPQSGRNI